MATITGGSATVVNAPQTPGGSGVIPVLQAQDGSFIGAAPDPNAYNRNNMVSFDAAGNVRWIVPNEQPQIATADGGVIGQSGIAYDSGGNATGQIGPLPLVTWTGTAYSPVVAVDQVAVNPLDVSTSYLAFAESQGGKTSPFETPQLPANGSAAKQPQFSLVGPINVGVIILYRGQEKLQCNGKPESPPEPTWYGYQECEEYQLSTNEQNPRPVRLDLRFEEDIHILDANPENVSSHTANGPTNPEGILWDDLSFGFPDQPPQPGQFSLTLQVVRLHSTDIPVRVNCIDFEFRNVTLTDITRTYDPNVPDSKQCIRYNTN